MHATIYKNVTRAELDAVMAALLRAGVDDYGVDEVDPHSITYTSHRTGRQTRRSWRKTASGQVELGAVLAPLEQSPRHRPAPQPQPVFRAATEYQETAAMRQHRLAFRAKLEREYAEEKARAEAEREAARLRRALLDPNNTDYAPLPPSPWGPVKLPPPWRPRPAPLAHGDYAPFREPVWSTSEAPAREPAPARRAPTPAPASDDGLMPCPKNPWGDLT